MTQKQARKEIGYLEEVDRITKVPLRKEENGRICAGWSINDNDNLPIEIRNVCQVCGASKVFENYGAERLCEPCFMAVKDADGRISLTSQQECQLSLWYATIATAVCSTTLG